MSFAGLMPNAFPLKIAGIQLQASWKNPQSPGKIPWQMLAYG
jgi:hypothetical protein